MVLSGQPKILVHIHFASIIGFQTIHVKAGQISFWKISTNIKSVKISKKYIIFVRHWEVIPVKPMSIINRDLYPPVKLKRKKGRIPLVGGILFFWVVDYYSNNLIVAEGVEDAVVVDRGGNVVCLLFQRVDSVAHGDADACLQNH